MLTIVIALLSLLLPQHQSSFRKRTKLDGMPPSLLLAIRVAAGVSAALLAVATAAR